MKSRLILALLITLAGSLTAGAADNSPSDILLKTPVTAYFRQERLHRVVKVLASSTGTSISCGDSPTDWQTRDIPVTVYAVDVHLGTLLTALADAIQLRLQTETGPWTNLLAPHGRISYRIDEGPDVRAKVRSYQRAREAWNTAEKVWEWDTLTKLSEVAPDTIRGTGDKDAEVTIALSRLVAALGPSARATLMSGRSIPLDYDQSSQSRQKLLKNLILAVMKAQERIRPDHTFKMTDKLFRNATLTFWPSDYTIRLNLRNSQISQDGGLGNYVSPSAYKLGWPAPVAPTQPALRQATTGLTEIDPWRHPSDNRLLAIKLTVPVPVGKTASDITAADFLAAVSKATGCAVVVEDFASQSSVQYLVQQLAGKEVTVGEILAVVCISSGEMSWWEKPSENLIVGSCREWVRQKENLLPESYLKNIGTKMDGDGLDLDDCLSILLLPADQRYEWITLTPEFSCLQLGFEFNSESLWPLYYSLSPSQKKQAATTEGLSLGKLDQSRVAAALDRASKDAVCERQLIDLASKPSAWPHLVMNLVQNDFRICSDGIDSRLSGPHPGTRLAHSYDLVISGMVNGATVSITRHGPGGVPVYSKAREMYIMSHPEIDPLAPKPMPPYIR